MPLERFNSDRFGLGAFFEGRNFHEIAVEQIPESGRLGVSTGKKCALSHLDFHRFGPSLCCGASVESLGLIRITAQVKAVQGGDSSSGAHTR